jgi:hypothetical protein
MYCVRARRSFIKRSNASSSQEPRRDRRENGRWNPKIVRHWLIPDKLVCYTLFHLSLSFCTSCTVRVTYCAIPRHFLYLSQSVLVLYTFFFISYIALRVSLSFLSRYLFSLLLLFFPLMLNNTSSASGKAKVASPRCCLYSLPRLLQRVGSISMCDPKFRQVVR